jgi:hypothetical protein
MRIDGLQNIFLVIGLPQVKGTFAVPHRPLASFHKLEVPPTASRSTLQLHLQNGFPLPMETEASK